MALIQTGFNQVSSGNVSGTFASPVNSGDLIIGFVFAVAFSGTVTVTDTQLNTYTPILGPVTNAWSIWLFDVSSAIGGSGNVITASFSVGSSFPLVGWAEFSGYSALDNSAPNTGTGTALSASCTTTGSNDLLIGWFGDNGSGIVAGSTELFNAGGGGALAQYAIASGSGPQTQTATGTSGLWVAAIAAFKTVAPGPPAVSALFPLPVYKAIGIL